MANSDAELIRRTLDGDDTAFGFLVDKYKGAVHALAYRKIGNFHTAEDITQDTFLKAYQKLSTLKDWRHFPGWLYRIASRLCLMWHRKPRLPTQPLDTVEKRHIDALALSKHNDQQTRQAVHDELELLPESQRTVLTLHYLGGMTCEEIARFIGTSRGAVLDRLYRARLQLKKEMIPMMEKTLGAFQLLPTFTQQTMNRIERTPSASTPESKPIVPWIAVAATLIVALFIGFGQPLMTRFQQPYSLDAPEPALQVELIDAPIIHQLEAKPALVYRPGNQNPRDDKKGIGPGGTAFAAVSNVETGKERNDTDWTQTNGPYGGDVTMLFRASDGTLYANLSAPGVFHSRNGGDSWTPINDWVGCTSDGLHTITEANGALYLSNYEQFAYSIDRGESWQWVHCSFGDSDMAVRAFGAIGARIYIGRDKDGVAYSDDYGESWTPIRDGLPAEPPDKLMTVESILFAKVDDDIFRLKAGENTWTQIASISELRFLTVEDGTLIIGSENELRRSTDQGETWTQITPDLENQSLEIKAVAAFGATIYVLLSDLRQMPEDLKLLRSTDNGRSWGTTEASGLVNYYYFENYSMVVLSEHAVCIGTADGAFRWTDGHESWRRINVGLIGTWIRNVVYFKNALYASTYNQKGIFKSVDGGNRWTPIHSGLPTKNVGALAVSGGTLYLGVSDANFGTDDPPTTAIYRLAIDQNSWIPVQTEMRTAHIDGDPHRGYFQFYSVEELAISGDTFYALAGMGNGDRLFRWRKGEQYWTHISPDIGFGPNDYLKSDDRGFAVSGETVYFYRKGRIHAVTR